MARSRTRIPLNVFLNGRHVGQLRRDTSGAIEFQYDPSWLAWDHAIPVSLSLPLQEERFIGAPVLAVFENLLPDNDTIRRRVAERSGAAGTDPYSLLTAIGRDCVGALQFIPDTEETKPFDRIEGRRLSDEEIGAILKDLGRNPLGIADGEFQISLAGAQEKTALLRWKGRWYQPEGTTPTTHILKPQIGTPPTVSICRTASKTSTSASNWFAPSIFRWRNRRSRNSTESGRSSSNASTASGQRTNAFCACRKKTAARLSPCRRASSTKIRAARVSSRWKSCSKAATRQARTRSDFSRHRSSSG